eukprot:3306767-Pleurochrysis_carterae.AAC.2
MADMDWPAWPDGNDFIACAEKSAQDPVVTLKPHSISSKNSYSHARTAPGTGAANDRSRVLKRGMNAQIRNSTQAGTICSAEGARVHAECRQWQHQLTVAVKVAPSAARPVESKRQLCTRQGSTATPHCIEQAPIRIERQVGYCASLVATRTVERASDTPRSLLLICWRLGVLDPRRRQSTAPSQGSTSSAPCA